ncbi:MAG: DNA primase [Lactobacillus sp.]|jgi:DNA primase|nr:DNA primase [Lactobacillus sp.]MCH3906248.1 DNA primase [Lactobacillus sp.]MCH3990176.1 DNA primase [Lactobacillus sp.]MCH4069110.1 DNA primase [Lactobacillus sp.]MCI1303903.1 DNA primase [Lactobacillus sp.]
MAGRIPEDFINEVRSAVNIVDVVSQYVSLTKKGKDYLGLCPFHQEKTPSFTVNEANQFFKCFGCGRGGNVFKFLMEKEGLTFPESVEQVANFVNIPMPAGLGKAVAPISPLKKVYQAACQFYQHLLLATKAGERGLAYARKRELNDETLRHFKIGYAPDNEKILLTFLKAQKYDDELLAKSGLFVQTKDGRLFDRFRDRLMFPLANESGQVVGFSGRRLSNDKTVAKYMNSPETEIFDKSKLLFHLAEAKKAARKEGHLLLYEGYMDVIAAYKAGVQAGVASMGTSLTGGQVYLLRRITPNIIINYDGDDPGVHAAGRAARMFARAGRFNLGIVVLPEKLDPDEYVKKYGPEKYQGEVKAAISPTDFFIRQLAADTDFNNDREQLNFINAAVAEVARLGDPLAEDVYLNKLAKQTGVSHDLLAANLAKARRVQRRVQQHTTSSRETEAASAPVQAELEQRAAVPNRPDLDRLLYLFIHSESARDYLLSRHFLFPDVHYADLAEHWLQYEETHMQANPNDFVNDLSEQEQQIVVNLEMKPYPADYSNDEIDEIINTLQCQQRDEQINQLQTKLAAARSRADVAAQLKITNQIISLKRANN